MSHTRGEDSQGGETSTEAWRPRPGEATFSHEQQARIERIEKDLREQLKSKPKRLAHSLSVSDTAVHLALLYDVDPYDAKVAGLLHDWDKALAPDELLERARGMGIDMGVDLELVRPLLHGIVAARELPVLYPDLDPAVFQAISRHTTGAADMSPLDEVIFVADGIEPLRKDTPGIHRSRELVGSASLEDLYWDAFAGGIVYVIETQRYLYPGTIEIYNALVAKRAPVRQKDGK